jgi:hypothetical protein
MKLTVVLLAIAALASTAHATHPCYVQKVVVQPQYVAVPIVQNVYYQVGSALQLDAIVDARVRAQLQAMQAQQQAPATAPATHPTTPPPDTGSTANVFVANCSKCHTGTTPKGGLTLDGITPIPPESGFEILRRLQLPVEDKEHMPPQVDLPPADKGRVLQELLTLTRKQEEVQPQLPPLPE